MKVLYFADAARRAGRSEESLGPESPATLAELQELVFARHPELSALRGKLLWSVDEEMAGPGTPLTPDCVVGVLPPFSGG